MLRLTKFFITLPLLSLPFWGLAPKLHAEAVLSQMDALRLLAKSRATDSKCKILPATEAEELASYLARAEVATATRYSVSEVQSTLTVGKALGDTAACSVATSSEVGATLAAARQAMALAQQPRISDDTTAEEKVVPSLARAASQPKEPQRATLASYGRQAAAYYLDLRCEYLSNHDIRVFWVAIIRQHRAALGAYGKPAVASTLRRARAQAGAMECGARSRQLVRSEYANLAQY